MKHTTSKVMDIVNAAAEDGTLSPEAELQYHSSACVPPLSQPGGGCHCFAGFARQHNPDESGPWLRSPSPGCASDFCRSSSTQICFLRCAQLCAPFLQHGGLLSRFGHAASKARSEVWSSSWWERSWAALFRANKTSWHRNREECVHIAISAWQHIKGRKPRSLFPICPTPWLRASWAP